MTMNAGLPAAPLFIAQGHDHVLTVPVSIGPLVLRIALLAAVAAIAGFAVLRGFVPESSRAATALVAASAVGAVVLELMLSAGLALPSQVVVLLLGFSGVPLWLILTGDERVARFVAWGQTAAPWVVAAMAAAAFVTCGWALLSGSLPPAVLHTAIVFALTGLSWFTLCRPATTGTAWVAVRVVASVLAMAAMVGTAYTNATRPPEPVQGAAPATNATPAYNDRIQFQPPQRDSWTIPA
nr:hypothetical protein [Kibdelosporangium sp. MJ126-NF4]